ncbi:MAG: chemotaxis protein CheW [Actinomycetota bacterium]
MSEIDEVVGEFLTESRENLEEYDADLLVLEADPGDAEALARAFRNLHTIKGTCGFLGFSKLEGVAHAGETLLGRLRDGELQVDRPIADALLAMGDAVRAILDAIEEDGSEGGGDYRELIANLASLAEGVAPVAPEADAEPAAEPTTAAQEPDDDAIEGGDGRSVEGPLLGELLVEEGKATSEQVGFAALEQDLGDDRRIGEILVEEGGVAEEDVEQALSAQAKARASGDSTIRVDVGLLDGLMNLVGELVLARNQIVQLAGSERDSALFGVAQRLNLVTTELQEGVMRTRMQPIGKLWRRMPRVVRDLAGMCEKEVAVDLEGENTELDKGILEAIGDPLTHLVRNAVDHGIESPEERVAAGKPRQGHLLMRAFHEGGQVVVEISDDGGGIDVAAVTAKAVDAGLVTAEQAAALGEREALNLLFTPGFSTAKEVTKVSGRGVGLDVVARNIHEVGGTVDVLSEKGVGSTFKVKIPLTLAIIPALVVGSGEDSFAIPQVNLVELVRLEGADARKGIEYIHGAPVHRLRGHLLPLVYLDEQLDELDLGHRDVVAEGEEGDLVRNIVVLNADGQQFGLVVDEIHETQEIVVKPLSTQVKHIPLFAGSTIMGDGRVALILDVLGVAQRSRVITEAGDRGFADAAAHAESETEQQALLLVGLGDDRRVAVPLAEVARLEEIKLDDIERSGHQEVVQYRDEILPLVRLGGAMGYPEAEPREDGGLDVVVHRRGQRTVGVIVGQVLDIVEEEVDIGDVAEAGAMRGSAVVKGRVTDVVDLAEIVDRGAGDRVGLLSGGF